MFSFGDYYNWLFTASGLICLSLYYAFLSMRHIDKGISPLVSMYAVATGAFGTIAAFLWIGPPGFLFAFIWLVIYAISERMCS